MTVVANTIRDRQSRSQSPFRLATDLADIDFSRSCLRCCTNAEILHSPSLRRGPHRAAHTRARTRTRMIVIRLHHLTHITYGRLHPPLLRSHLPRFDCLPAFASTCRRLDRWKCGTAYGYLVFALTGSCREDFFFSSASLFFPVPHAPRAPTLVMIVLAHAARNAWPRRSHMRGHAAGQCRGLSVGLCDNWTAAGGGPWGSWGMQG